MYILPKTLGQDISELGLAAKSFENGEIASAAFKMKRVPMGIYEQRRDGTYMVRVRTKGGVITPDQFIRIVGIARENGSDLLHITTRQEIQFQNVRLDTVESILGELQKIGLSSKGGGGNTVRNILVPPDSGINGDEAFDPTAHAMAITSKLIDEKDSFTMPRKLKIAFSASEEKTDYAAVNDLGFVARIKDGKRGFKVYIGGSAASKPTVGWILSEFVPEEDIFVVAEAVKQFFSQHGNRRNRHKARLRYIFYTLGEKEALRLLHGYYQAAEKTTPKYIPTEITTTQVSDYRTNAEGFGPGYRDWVRRYVRPQIQSGMSIVRIPVIHGNIPVSDQIHTDNFLRLLYFISRFGDDTVRFTPGQDILLRNIPTAAFNELQDLVKTFAPQSQQPAAPNNIISCTGADTCRLGICLSKGLAAAIRRKIIGLPEPDKLPHLHLNISGCPNSCGQQLWADLGFSGRALRNDRLYPAYRVYAGARRGSEPKLAEALGDIPAKDIPGFTARVLADYADQAGRYPSFADYIDAEGKGLILKLIGEYSAVPSFSEDRNYYYDWGSDDLFTIAGRGMGECSAGLFDMIDIDKGHIADYKDRLAKEIDPERLTELYYKVLFSSARMLLVTRGAEPKSDEEVFTLFSKLFLDTGLVDARFRDVIDIAAKEKRYPFGHFREKILALAEVVNALYDNMDDSLQFKTDRSGETE